MNGPLSLLGPSSSRAAPGGRLDAARAARDVDATLEATFLKALLDASGAFSLGDTAGASTTQDLVLETLAAAIVDGGSLLGLGARSAPSSEVTLGARALTPSSSTRAPSSVATPTPTIDVLHELVASDAARVSSAFGTRTDPFTGEHKHHAGIDIAAPEGSPVRAITGGVVRHAGPRGDYGNLVEIETPTGGRVRYAHLAAASVRVGDQISAGTQVGAVGSTGRATGSHLHLEIRDPRGVAADPTSALRALTDRSDRRDGAVSLASPEGRRP